MRPESFAFLKALAEIPSPSGYEQPAQKVFREYIQKHVDQVQTDVLGKEGEPASPRSCSPAIATKSASW